MISTKSKKRSTHHLIDAICMAFHVSLVVTCGLLCIWFPWHVPIIILVSFMCLAAGIALEFTLHHVVNLVLDRDGHQKPVPALISDDEKNTPVPHSTCKIQTALTNQAVMSNTTPHIEVRAPQATCPVNAAKKHKVVEAEADEESHYRASLNM